MSSQLPHHSRKRVHRERAYLTSLVFLVFLSLFAAPGLAEPDDEDGPWEDWGEELEIIDNEQLEALLAGDDPPTILDPRDDLWIEGVELVDEIWQFDCGRTLREEVRLIQDLADGRGNGDTVMRLQELGGLRDDCEPEPAEFTLADGLILPPVDAGRRVPLIVLNPPPGVNPGFELSIVASTASFTDGAPLGGYLFGGAVTVLTDGMQIGLSTTAHRPLPDCVRSNTFTLRLRDQGVARDFEVTLPVRLKTYPANRRFRAGEQVDLTLCGAGDVGPTNWVLDQDSGDPGLPSGLAMQVTADDQLRIHGTVQTTSHHWVGRIRAEQTPAVPATGTRHESPVQFFVGTQFFSTIEPACGTELIVYPDVPFRCELPRPMGYENHTWSWQGATDELDTMKFDGDVALVPDGPRWFLEGTIPESVYIGPPMGGRIGAVVGIHGVELALSAEGYDLATRIVDLNVQEHVSVLTQNMILRPNNPFVPNTGSDNTQRADLLLNRIGSFDVVALQEVFDDDQRSQLALGASQRDFNVAWGPTRESSCWYSLGIATCVEDSGLMLLVNDSFATGPLGYSNQAGNPDHLSREFETDCEDSDCRAHKGFSITSVDVGAADVVVVNTHLQSSAGVHGQYAGTRSEQLQEIVDWLAIVRDPRYPALLVGDLNVDGLPGSSGNQPTELEQRFADRLPGWTDPIGDLFAGSDRLVTVDKGRNAYAHFWDDHIWDHRMEDLRDRDGIAACAAVFGLLRCAQPVEHPDERERLDYMLVLQGSEYRLELEGAARHADTVTTDLCRNAFPMSDHPGMRCYLSDHYGVSARFRVLGPRR